MRQGYEVLSAMAKCQERVKDLPKEVTEAMDSLKSALDAHMNGGDSKDGSDGDAAASMADAKEKTRERYRKSAESEKDESEKDS